jgi:tetratricopeptide (TPR) repeat protein
MGKCHEELGQPVDAEKVYHLACAEAPNTREPWCEIALLMYRQSRWAECLAYSLRALQIVDRELVYTCDPAVWGHWADDLAAVSAWQLGLKELALKHSQAAVEKSPDDARLQRNLRLIQGLEKD